jgi:hypothetical protein
MFKKFCGVVTFEAVMNTFEGFKAKSKQCALLAESLVLENLLPCIHTIGVRNSS